MGEIARSDRQITLYYHSSSGRAEQALAYTQTKGLAVQAIDFSKRPLTGTQIIELANGLEIEVKELVNQEHPAYTSKFEHTELSTDDWIKMIRHNPEIMKQPIALLGEKTMLIETPTDIMHL